MHYKAKIPYFKPYGVLKVKITPQPICYQKMITGSLEAKNTLFKIKVNIKFQGMGPIISYPTLSHLFNFLFSPIRLPVDGKEKENE